MFAMLDGKFDGYYTVQEPQEVLCIGMWIK